MQKRTTKTLKFITKSTDAFYFATSCKYVVLLKEFVCDRIGVALNMVIWTCVDYFRELRLKYKAQTASVVG